MVLRFNKGISKEFIFSREGEEDQDLLMDRLLDEIVQRLNSSEAGVIGKVSGSGLTSVEGHEVTATEDSVGFFQLDTQPSDASKVLIFRRLGTLQVAVPHAVGGETPDFEVVGRDVKINAASSPTVALSGDIATPDRLTIIY